MATYVCGSNQINPPARAAIGGVQKKGEESYREKKNHLRAFSFQNARQ